MNSTGNNSASPSIGSEMNYPGYIWKDCRMLT
ncbi:hypothetical protein D0U02_26365 [Burkholderia pseudomallei]|uniref:Uncharacterized protein n=1 Tax=Burkholderia pseudomallei TaxID=28450 RepID=A0AAX0U4K3_BURPE|nr:hypothetical protein CNX72_17100 [Burkholderia pseudomallei]AYX07935.1 hypothetical protein EGY14_30830 [Burkholderia pseudomallei]AYX34365.1 hypothetical protein EGY15_03685 [Burkholderia pseudomallei]MBK3336550.1 hypothetical protein [Burkholderia pseudomallei]MPT61492.1 hypothetical protein [Burkholderia pseudomallei]